MSAIYGFVGEADDSLLRAMGDRLGHRGLRRCEWSPNSGLHLGMRWPDRADSPSEPPELPVAVDGFVSCRRSDAADDAPRVPDERYSSDGSLLLEVLQSEGPEGLRWLRGPFSAVAAVHDTVWLARDPLGYRQLYYASVGSRVLFASEYKAILADPELPARPDRAAIEHIHRLKTQPADKTCVQGIQPVPPGCCVGIGGRESPTVRRYWDFDPPMTSARREEMITELRRRMREALKSHLLRAERIGVALSGGLDSTVTLALLREIIPDREIATFSAGYGPDDPELEAAAAAAEHFGTAHHQIVMEPGDLPRVLPETVWHMEEPVGREDTAYLYRTCELASNSVDLLLSGYDADLLFGGMPRHLLTDVARRFPPVRPALRGFLEYARYGRRPSTLSGRLLVLAYFRGHACPAPSVLEEEQTTDNAPASPEDLSRRLTEHLRHQAMGTSHGTYDALHQAFGLSMGSPFGDQEVVDWAFRLPDDVKIRGLKQKWVLREASRGLLPESGRRRPKTLQRLRHGREFSETLETMSQDLLTPDRVRRRGLFDPDYVARIRRRPDEGEYSDEQAYRLWSLILTELWAEAFLDRRGRPLS